MIETSREDLNQHKIKEMAGKYPIAKIFAREGFGICFIHEIRKEEIVVEDLFGQIHPIKIKDLILMQFFLNFEEVFKAMKEERAIFSDCSRLKESFGKIEKKLVGFEA
jgi:citrate lyase alpha subunit